MRRLDARPAQCATAYCALRGLSPSPSGHAMTVAPRRCGGRSGTAATAWSRGPRSDRSYGRGRQTSGSPCMGPGHQAEQVHSAPLSNSWSTRRRAPCSSNPVPPPGRKTPRGYWRWRSKTGAMRLTPYCALRPARISAATGVWRPVPRRGIYVHRRQPQGGTSVMIEKSAPSRWAGFVSGLLDLNHTGIVDSLVSFRSRNSFRARRTLRRISRSGH